MDKKRSPDLLTDLPLSIIHDILSLVPIRDAVRTSLLSRQWRYIWASLPYLVFDRECVNPPMETEIDQKRLIHFITQALLLHIGPIQEFELCIPPIEEFHWVNQWLLFLSKNDIRILFIDIYYYDWYDYDYAVHSSLYSFQYLTHLKLHVHNIPPPPASFNGFLFLRSLDIYTNNEDSSTFERIVSHSPLLEEFTLDSSKNLKMTIHALNLEYLDCSSVYDLTLCTPLLQDLTGCFEYTSSFSIGVESLVFHHLRTIQLFDVSFKNKEVAPTVFRLITGAPNLQKLEISGYRHEDEPKPDCFWDAESAPDITYNSLKVIKMDIIGGYVDDMKLIEFLLARSPVLKTLMYNRFTGISETKLLNLTTQLLRYPQASANAQIVIGRRQRLLR